MNVTTTPCTDSAQYLLGVLGDNLLPESLSEIIERIIANPVSQEDVVAAMSPPEGSNDENNNETPLGYPIAHRREVATATSPPESLDDEVSPGYPIAHRREKEDEDYHYGDRVVSVYYIFVALAIGFLAGFIFAL